MGILFHENKHLLGLKRGRRLSLFIGFRDFFSVQGIGLGELFVAIGLAGLGEQYQRCRVSRLKAEHQVQQDEGVDIEFGQPRHIDHDPGRNDKGLTH